ncbi:histone-lysine N-methyltransferase SETMAR [Trichonephila clavipes]|nr:histone-lysine N-methyltransferase SETMAR [Trichonephila clavipes]
MCDQATEADGLVPPLQSLTKLASLRRLFLAQQPLAMELPLASPASCELRSVIRFLAAKKKSAKEIHEELCQVYGEECMSSGMVRRWVRDFKNGQTDVHDEARAGRPSASDETIAKVEAAMLEDRRTTVRELLFKGLQDGYQKCSLQTTSGSELKRPKNFSLFTEQTEEEFLDSIVTGDETWVHYTTRKQKKQLKQWKHPSSPRAKKFKQILSAGKIMASIFWDRKGVLLCEFMPRGTTINADRYCETLNKLRRAIQNKRRGMLTKGVRFHHDNAQPHTANRTTALVERFGWEMVSHPPYSPDLAPSDFHLFPELKKNLGGTQFQTDEEVQNAVVNFLHGQAAEFYHSGLKKVGA